MIAPVRPVRTSTVLLVASLWLAVAAGVAASGAPARLRSPAPQLILLVVEAARVALVGPAGMTGLLRLPFALLPFFLVPLIIASHVLLFVRLDRRRRGVEAAASRSPHAVA